jgi:diacylglycerol O-acyltransferase / wax synthase
MTKPSPPLDLSWLLIESPASTMHVGAMLLSKKPAGRTPIVREIVEAYRAYLPAPPFNYVPELLGRSAPHFREVASWEAQLDRRRARWRRRCVGAGLCCDSSE